MIFRSLWHDRRINTAVLLGVLCAAAVLTGALLVGDSMRGSLRALTLDRLGRIDTELQGVSFFEPPAEFIEGKLPEPWTKARSAILLPAAVEANGKITATQLLGLEDSWASPVSQLWFGLKQNEVAVNHCLADRLGLKLGDTISLRLHSPQDIPPESSLGRRNDLIVRARMTVKEIIPDEGLGRFSLKADQQAEPLLLVPLEWVQNRLKVDGKVNVVFFMTDAPQTVSTSEQRAELKKRFKPSAADLGIDANNRYVKSGRMMFTKSQAEAIQKACPEARPGLLYLATSIKALRNGNETPYSTVFAFDLDKEPGTERSAVPGPAPVKKSGDCAALHPRLFVNQWTANDLDVSIGDEIELIWFAPENVNETKAKIFRLEGILPMDDLGADPHLVPEIKGFTDEAAIADWDPPFPFDAKKIRKKDEDYWDRYRAAPKAFVPLETGQELWGSRFGDVTTFVMENGEWRMENGELPPSLFGLTFLPVKEQGLAASAGTTPFSVLFLSFSFFIIASALMLVALLFRLSVEMKARQIGIRLAVGWTRRQIARLLLAEGFVIATLGSLLGVGFGVLYARLMVYGLTTWWVDAVTVPFLKLYVTPTSLVIGFLGGVVMSLVTILWTLRSVRKVPVKSLLGGDFSQRAGDAAQRSPRTRPAKRRRQLDFLLESIILLFCIYGICLLALSSPERSFAFSSLLLVLGLWWYYSRYFRAGSETALRSLSDFARSNMIRNRGRSFLCIALIASTTFLLLSIGAFRLEPERSMGGSLKGSGRFNYVAETAFPVYHDIGSVEGRKELGIQDADEEFLEEQRSLFLSFRMQGGDNASCLNLYQANRPRILGIPKAMQEHSPGIAFVAKTPETKPWQRLQDPVTTDPDGVPRVPIILDANTAMYALHLYGGVGETYEIDDGNGGKIRCEIIGLLGNSIFQGDMLMGEANLLKLFPEVGGYRYFLFGHSNWYQKPDDRTQKIFYDLLGDYGFQGEPTADRLRKLFAVQNTYLSTFQSLGGIGLLLGVFGLAVIQLRNVFERRKELALMQAVGFTKSRIILLQLYESFSLLTKGLGLAVLATTITLLPFFFGYAVHVASFLSVVVQFIWLVGGMVLVGLVSNVAASLAVLRIPVARELAEER